MAVCDRELELGMTDPYSSRTLYTFSFSGQVRSLTYNVISKPPDGHKMCNCGAPVFSSLVMTSSPVGRSAGRDATFCACAAGRSAGHAVPRSSCFSAGRSWRADVQRRAPLLGSGCPSCGTWILGTAPWLVHSVSTRRFYFAALVF